MKLKKLFTLLLVVVLVVTQFAMLGSVSATTALSGRNDFALGVNIHSYAGFNAYKKTAQVLSDANALGANIVRTNIVSNNMAYNVAVADMAAKKGMQVMAVAGFDYYDNVTNTPIAANNIDVAGITSTFTAMATALNGKVAYYQLSNEMDIKMHTSSSNGLTADQFADCSGIAVAIYAANTAIKSIDPNAKTVVNFSWHHMGLIDAIKSVALDAETGLPATNNTTNVVYADWDIIGLDWYSNGRNNDFRENGLNSDPIDYDYIIEELERKHPDNPVIVCEAGLWPYQNEDGSLSYMEDAQWLEDFLTYCYNNDHVISFIAYELYDQPDFESETFNREAHFGLIDKDGNKKATYDTLCALYGGTGVDNTWYSPEMLASQGQFIISEGETFTSTYSSTAITGQGHLPGYSSGTPAEAIFTNPVLADYSYFEFDYYVENITNFNARETKLYLNLRTNTQSKGTYEFTDQITQTGWNHVKITITNLSADTLNSIIKVRFYMDINAGATGATDPYIISNICATKDLSNTVPNLPQSDGIFVIGAGVKIQGVLGNASKTGQAHLPGYSSGTPAEVIFTNPGLANYDYFEFDYYVENIANFNARGIKMYFNIRIASGSKKTYEFTDQITQSGWNHIKLAMNSDASTLNVINRTRFYIDMNAGETGASDSYKIANICATKDLNNAN